MKIILKVVILTLLLMMTGCTTTKYIPVESVRTEYRDVDTAVLYDIFVKRYEASMEREMLSDSVIDRTRETVVLLENGDTARHDRERLIYRASKSDRELESKVRAQDSIIRELRASNMTAVSDTIRIPYPVETVKEVARERSWWETMLLWTGGIAILVALISVCFKIRGKMNFKDIR